MSDTALNITPTTEDSQFVRFWNEVLAAKFIRFKHILVGGLSRHSEAVFPSLPVRPGDHVHVELPAGEHLALKPV